MRSGPPALSLAHALIAALAGELLAAASAGHAASAASGGPAFTAARGIAVQRMDGFTREAGGIVTERAATAVVRPPTRPTALGGMTFDFIPPGTGERAGSAVATAGDVDGDGYSDLIVGAPTYSNGQPTEGQALLFRGGPNGFTPVPSWSFESNSPGAFFGGAVAPAGDVNGDGYADVIIGASDLSGTLGHQGRAFVFLGGASGLANAPVWTIDGPNAGARLGFSVNTAGDVNGDGYDDVIVGAPGGNTAFATGTGLAYVVLGGPGGPTGAPFEMDGLVSGWNFGYSVSTAGDVNADGYDDVVVGWPLASGAGGVPAGGRARVYLGAAAGPSSTPTVSFLGAVANEQLGWSVAGAGDTNGDGYADIVVGAPGYVAVVLNEGAVLLFQGGPGPLPATPAFTDYGPVYSGAAPGARLGESVAPAGDVNGDGFADFVAGGPHYSLDAGPNVDKGCFCVYEGTSGPAGAALVARQFGTSFPGGQLGASVCAAGDGNADGFGDIVVGEPLLGPSVAPDGRVQVFAGAADMPQAVAGREDASHVSTSLVCIGDVNGDGFDDVAGSMTSAPGPRLPVYLGTHAGPSTIAFQQLNSVAIDGDDNLFSCGPAGDVNGDGYDDVMVVTYTNATPATVQAHVLPGGAGGIGGTPIDAMPPQPLATFENCQPAGDVNGDGYADVLRFSASQVKVYLGGPAGLAAAPATTTAVGGAVDWVVPAGDCNGDGFDDLLVTETSFTGALTQQGRVRLFPGSASGLAAVPSLTLVGRQANALLFGQGNVGDLNGDGFGEFACSEVNVMSLAAQNFTNPDDIDVVYGNAALPMTVLTSPDAVTMLASARVGGDVDGDGYSDLVVDGFTTSPLPSAGATDVWLHRGGPAGVAALPSWAASTTFGGFAPYAGFPGDLNGDGFADVLWSHDDDPTPNATTFVQKVFYGNGLETGVRPVGRSASQWRDGGLSPISVVGLSDQDDRFRLRAPGRSAAGRTRVRLQSDVRPWSGAFDVAGLQSTSWQPTLAPTPGSDGSLYDHFDQARTSLPAGTRYKWRARVAAHSPYFPWTSWLTPARNGRQQADLRTAGPGLGAVGDLAPAALALAPPMPNPMRTSATLRFSLAHPGDVSLRTYDLAGRVVATLAQGRLAAGTHEVRWDGRDSGGAMAAEGVYFVRLTTPEGGATRRLVLLR